MSDLERELDWDDEIENDGPEFTLLPEGDYDFEVIDFERARYEGGVKLPPCKKAIVHIKIDTPEGIAIIKHNLFMYKTMEGLLCAFFAGIGQRKKGEKLKMNWSTVVGSTGRVKVGVREYTTDSGEKRKTNEIKKFYEYKQDPSVLEGFSEITTSHTSFSPGEF